MIHNEYMREYYQKNRKRILDQQKIYREKNKYRLRDKRQSKYENNREAILLYHKQRRNIQILKELNNESGVNHISR